MKNLFKETDEFIGTEKTAEDLIEILHFVQNKMGYLPREAMTHIASRLKIPEAEVYGTVSFYSYFTMNPNGKHVISVCAGTACHVKGADKILEKIKDRLDIKAYGTSKDGQFTLKETRCVGTCSLAPVIMIDDKIYGNTTEDDVEKILGEI